MARYPADEELGRLLQRIGVEKPLPDDQQRHHRDEAGVGEAAENLLDAEVARLHGEVGDDEDPDERREDPEADRLDGVALDRVEDGGDGDDGERRRHRKISLAHRDAASPWPSNLLCPTGVAASKRAGPVRA